MRTTITIPEELLRKTKLRAAEDGSTVSLVIAQALRSMLASERATELNPAFKLVTYRGSRAFAGVDLDKTSVLLAADDVRRYRQ